MRETQGTYHDGRSAVTHPVRVELEDGEITIFDEDGKKIGVWPCYDIERIKGTSPKGEARLRRSGDADARLTVRDPDFIAELREVCPIIDEERFLDGASLRFVAVLGLGTIAAVLVLFFGFVPLLAGVLSSMVPLDFEQRLGQQLAENLISGEEAQRAELEPEAGGLVCAGPEGQRALDALARELGGIAGVELPLVVRVLDLPEANAWTLPGGQILVLRGLLELAETPDELTGVLAHEVAHVVHRDPTRVVLEVAGTSVLMGLILGDFLGGGVAVGIAETLVTTSYSRDAEWRADLEAVDILNKAGVDAEAFGTLMLRLGKLQASERSDVLTYFSTHPQSGQRADMIIRSADPGEPQVSLSEGEWQSVRAICARE